MYIIYRADAVQRLLDNVKNVLQKTRLKLFPNVKKVFNNSNSDALFFQIKVDEGCKQSINGACNFSPVIFYRAMNVH